MKKPVNPTKQTQVALQLFAAQLEVARREQAMPQAELAERAGVSINTLKSVLRGEPQVALGTAFEVATILRVPLFDEEPSRRTMHLNELRSRLTLMPKAARKPTVRINDEF